MTSGNGRPAAAPTWARLVGTELRRLVARRFTRVLLAVCVLGYLTAVIFLWALHGRPGADDLARAAAARDAEIAQIQVYVDDCLAEPGGGPDRCGFVPTADDLPVATYLDRQPFEPDLALDLTLLVGVAVAMAGFVLGATFIGAEWSTKNLVALLFYEPRRMRVMGAKLLVLCAGTLLAAVVAQLVWLLTARLLIEFRGTPVSDLGSAAAGFWADVAATQLRAALLVLPTTVLGFGLASMLHNTAAALGIAFGYFVIVENLLALIDPGLQRYQLVTGLLAWVSPDGFTVYGDPVYDPQAGYLISQEILVSQADGALVLVTYAAVVLAVALMTFRRRDIS